jgi:hypothetical protein
MAVQHLTARQVKQKRVGAADEGDELEALSPKPKTSRPSAQHRIYPTCAAALRSTEPSMGCRHHLHPDGPRLPPHARPNTRSAAAR